MKLEREERRRVERGEKEGKRVERRRVERGEKDRERREGG